MSRSTNCLAACLLPLALLASSCGESQEPPTRLNQTLGNVKEGTPLVQATADPGILADPATYQPAQPPTGSAAASGSTPDLDSAVSESSPEASAKSAVEFLADSIRDGELDDALRAFNPEHVAALGDEQLDPLYDTFETLYEMLMPELEDKLGADYADSLQAELRGDLKCEVIDPEHAQVAPNPAALLFGPVKELSNLTISRDGGPWRFQLDTALTDTDVEAIVAYHEKLQQELNKIIDWLSEAENVSAERVSELVHAALAGETVDVGAAGAAEPESSDTTTDEPDENTSEQPAADREENPA